MTIRTLAATSVLSFAIVSPLFAGGHGQHRQNIGNSFKRGGLNVNDYPLSQSIAKDDRSQLFADANVTKTKGGNQVIWANSGPDCLVAPVQSSPSTKGGGASKFKSM